jgi:succinate dehydrogenase/fumarate reductase cytochrome b subunit (b558 family)
MRFNVLLTEFNILQNGFQFFDVGFQLSFVAVFGIFWLNQPILKYLPKPKNKFQNLMVNVVSISIAAQIVTLPLVVFYFHQYSVISIVANLIVIPFSEILIIFSLLMTVLIEFSVQISWLNFLYDTVVTRALQLIHFFAVIFHFVMGFVLELKNRSARPVKYAMNNGSANSTWMSRNMIISGLVVLAFLGLHMYDFWWHEINFKYVEANTPDNERFWHELHAKFADAWRVIFYIIAFVLLGLHLA